MKPEKYQLLHPEGKKLSKIDLQKYEVLKNAILSSLNKKSGITHTALFEMVKEYLVDNSIEFEGSVEWYMEGVKLDLEAHKIIERKKEGKLLLFFIK